MGEQNVKNEADDRELRTFMKSLLNDVRALERMLEEGIVESGIRRIGAEQEMFIVDQMGQPAPLAVEVLEALEDERFTTELARFNLEANIPPSLFGETCLREMEEHLLEVVEKASKAAQGLQSDVALMGILPSLRQSHLGLDNMTPNPRYFALNTALSNLRGGEFRSTIKGVDQLDATHDNVMMEACNTSFQIHFQVGPEEFAKLYNVAQLVSAPVLAAGVNSPLLLGRRLWKETRVALFQQSIDARSTTHQARGQKTRVSFGDAWVDESILEIFREDIARFRVVLATEIEEDPMEMLDRGEPPPLSALRLHNGTVYRWNRPCYGVNDGVAHIRIENRALPSGPTVLDEVANAAFFFGLMVGVTEELDDVAKAIPFEAAKDNFYHAARHGLEAQFTWLDGRTCTAEELILKVLLPVARSGLKLRDLDSDDIDKYLGVVEERVRSNRTGARWMLDSLASMRDDATPDECHRALVTGAVSRQKTRAPVHTWDKAVVGESGGWRASYRNVGQFMKTDILTVRPEDLVDLAASLMDWERIRYIPVEDDQGLLVGVISYRVLLRLLARGEGEKSTEEPVAVRDVMKPNPITVTPETTTLTAIKTMRNKKVGCLPVVEEGRLVGLITERDLIDVSAKLLEEQLQEDE